MTAPWVVPMMAREPVKASVQIVRSMFVRQAFEVVFDALGVAQLFARVINVVMDLES